MTAKPETKRAKRRTRVTYSRRETVLSAGACRYCGYRSGGLVIDHVVPLCRGGTNALDNLAPACRRCNTEKGTLLVEEWEQIIRQRGWEWPPAPWNKERDVIRYFPRRYP